MSRYSIPDSVWYDPRKDKIIPAPQGHEVAVEKHPERFGLSDEEITENPPKVLALRRGFIRVDIFSNYIHIEINEFGGRIWSKLSDLADKLLKFGIEPKRQVIIASERGHGREITTTLENVYLRVDEAVKMAGTPEEEVFLWKFINRFKGVTLDFGGKDYWVPVDFRKVTRATIVDTLVPNSPYRVIMRYLDDHGQKTFFTMDARDLLHVVGGMWFEKYLSILDRLDSREEVFESTGSSNEVKFLWQFINRFKGVEIDFGSSYGVLPPDLQYVTTKATLVGSLYDSHPYYVEFEYGPKPKKIFVVSTISVLRLLGGTWWKKYYALSTSPFGKGADEVFEGKMSGVRLTFQDLVNAAQVGGLSGAALSASAHLGRYFYDRTDKKKKLKKKLKVKEETAADRQSRAIMRLLSQFVEKYKGQMIELGPTSRYLAKVDGGEIEKAQLLGSYENGYLSVMVSPSGLRFTVETWDLLKAKGGPWYEKYKKLVNQPGDEDDDEEIFEGKKESIHSFYDQFYDHIKGKTLKVGSIWDYNYSVFLPANAEVTIGRRSVERNSLLVHTYWAGDVRLLHLGDLIDCDCVGDVWRRKLHRIAGGVSNDSVNDFDEFFEAKKIDGGDCFVAANHFAMANPKAFVVHAYVDGQGPLSGRRFVHAWNEVGDDVIDNSNGRKIKLSKELYYILGNVNPDDSREYAKYSSEEAMVKMVKANHHGPWDLR